MKTIRKEDLSQEVFELYDAYAHSKIDRREFMNKLSNYAVGGISVAALAAFLMPQYAQAQQIQASDPRLNTEYIIYNSPKGGGEIRGLLAKPAKFDWKLPAVVVIHENRGLNPYIEDTARALALEGFIALAPDALSPLGGYPGNDDEGRAMQSQRDREDMLQDFIAAYEFLKSYNDSSGHIGAVGFCFGGWVANMMAVRIPELEAAVPFYGTQPEAEEVPKIQAALMLHFAEFDQRVNAGWPAYEAALQSNDIHYSAFMYPGVNHGFHNNSTPRYDEAAANLAWQRTVSFFREKLIPS
ncbi:MAG: dienelactone hydrolase family protein [Cyclobacteriaceae bacterium]|nr:dienelactone hydrolase family protein [Cyclobacteriaceae bacterium]